MGCGSCGTTTGGVSAGCGNNGTCGTSGCNKLNVYNWLSDMELPDGQHQYPIVEVRFKGSHKDFFRKQENMDLKTGDVVAVEGSPGHDIGTVSLAGELVRLQLKKKRVAEDSSEIKTLYRIARPPDIEKWESVKALENSTMFRARTIANSFGLKMKLSDVEYQGDGKKATFYYTAEDRVDFRELIKKLAEEFRIRVEMKQVGMRQEASRLGGIGSCGRELCCSTWLTSFKAVSTSAARYQNLSLNPAKLAGQCGKLKCCLNYELDSYLDAIKDIPDSNIRLQTMKGTAVHQKTDIFKRLLWYSLITTEKKDEDNMHSDKWIVISVDHAKEIIEMNRNNQKPEDLADPDTEEIIAGPDYTDMVGQDSLTRMDHRKKKKKKKKRNKNRSNNPQQQNQNKNVPR
ncbi:MAG TPA: regulatory iron-sulfur-containing complex subunit RicT [Bacteroidia bacterium]|nr:regulatory iron-sulfur-containing complex subunit RicT [Bacteroidia bacterium]